MFSVHIWTQEGQKDTEMKRKHSEEFYGLVFTGGCLIDVIDEESSYSGKEGRDSVW